MPNLTKTVNDVFPDDTKITDEALENASTEAQWSDTFVKRTMRKVDLLIIPLVCLIYLSASLDKSNLGNAKKLGMITDLGGDPTGDEYAFLNSLYFIAYAPLMIPFALLSKRTKVTWVITLCAVYWGIASACFAAVTSFGGAQACRFIVGMGEAGFSPTIPFYLARWYTRRDLGKRVAYWLICAPLGGFVNGLIAYGAAKMETSLPAWKVLFIIEGVLTVFLGIVGFLVLPEDIPSCRWFTAEEKEFLLHRRSLEASTETNVINWKQARACFWRWQQLFPVALYSSIQLSGAVLSAFLPTFASENGFHGATAQIATLAPYGSAAVLMLVCAYFSDRVKNRGWFVGLGFWLSVIGFAIYLGVAPEQHAAKFVALIFAEVGHYIPTVLINVWAASNCGSESRRIVTIPLCNAVAQALSIASGYLFPEDEGPKYTRGSAVCLGFAIFGTLMSFGYQILLKRENKKRDEREGVPPEGVFPDTEAYADDAKYFRYQL